VQEGEVRPKQIAIFPEDRVAPPLDCEDQARRAAITSSPAMGCLLVGLSPLGSAEVG
jgi:hypothetical protein